MRMSYDREKDVMVLELSKKKIDYAEESGAMVIHFSKDRHPVLLEILDASQFIAEIATLGMRVKKERFVPLSV